MRAAVLPLAQFVAGYAAALAPRTARRSQRRLIRFGLLLALGGENPGVWSFVLGLLLTGVGVGIMLTASTS